MVYTVCVYIHVYTKAYIMKYIAYQDCVVQTKEVLSKWP